MEATTYEYANWVLGGLAVFMVAMLVIGYYASTKVKDAEDYMAAGHRLGVLLCTGTLFATWFGAATAMGGAGNAYLFGNQGVLFDPWGAGLCLLIVGLFFARLIRRGRFLTVLDMVESRYSRKVGMSSAIVLYFADLGWLAGMLVGLGAILNQFAGIDMNTGIIIACVIVVIYTYMGGMWAVTLTDFWQMLILIAGVVIIFFAMWPQGGGFDAVFNNTPANWSSINQWSFIPTPESAADPEIGNAGFFYYTGIPGWAYWIAAIFSLGLGVIPTQSLLQRFLAAKDELTAVRAGYLGSLLYLTVGMLPVLIGMIYFNLNPDLTIDEALTKILLYCAVDYLPPVLTVIFIIALTAAIMSSADSILLAVSSLLGKNVQSYFRPEATDEQILKMTRRLIPLNAILALAIGLSTNSILNLAVASGVCCFVGITVPFIAGFFWKKANCYGAIASTVGGIVSWIIGYFYFYPMTAEANTGIVEDGVVYADWAFWDALYISSGIAPLVGLVLLVVVSLATQKINAPKAFTDVDGNPMDMSDFFGNPFKRQVPQAVVEEEKL